MCYIMWLQVQGHRDNKDGTAVEWTTRLGIHYPQSTRPLSYINW